MRVLQITAYGGWGCTGRIALGIDRALKHNNDVSAIAWGRVNTLPEDVFDIKIGNKYDQILHGFYTRITDKCGFGSKRITRKFIKKIDDFNPDLIQLHILHGYYINIELLFQYIKSKNIPVVWTFHDCWAFTGHCPYFDLVGCEKWKFGCRNCEQKLHHPKSLILDNSKWNYQKKKNLLTGIKDLTIVTPSKWLADLVKQSFLKEYPVVVINNGINLMDFKPSKSDFRERYNLQDKKIVLGVSSTWCKSKGIDDFIELSKILDDSYKIVLVGLTKKQMKNIPTNIIAIERTDSVEELAQIYSEAYVFINPTYEDNYPTTNLESIACGTPIISYKTGGSIEVVNSKTGLIVDQGDIQGIYSAITKLNSINYDKIIEESKVFDEKIKFKEYVELYKKIIMNNS